MKKLTMLKGLPASGKSTHAKSILRSESNHGRVNRDDIRKMVFGKWTGANEKIVVEIEKAIAGILSKNGKHVIVDDTNLTSRHEDMWKQVSKDLGVQFEKKEFDTHWKECLIRDFNRPNPVGPNVITKMAAKNGMIEWPDKPIVILDIDGTAADGTHREHYVKGEKKDWGSYYSLLSDDKPVYAIFKWVSELAKDHTIVVVSGRPDDHYIETMRWFEQAWKDGMPEFDIFQMFLRNSGDHRPDDLVKREILELIPDYKDKVAFVLDDRPRVVRMWKEQGLTVFPVRGAVEEF